MIVWVERHLKDLVQSPDTGRDTFQHNTAPSERTDAKNIEVKAKDAEAKASCFQAFTPTLLPLHF